ncbi:MAG: TIGR00645 family protein [Pedosphaera sp.]|nr:TIGR00645 family protein [Pedosphaera sp.]MSU44526.1 TIGR00645 family protein [Pedosphaera sp.]
MQFLQDLLEKVLYHGRWLLAPLYFGLLLTLVMVVVKFGQEFWHIAAHLEFITMTAPALTLAVLEMVDLLLVANLVMMIIFSGYENFVSKIGEAQGHEDRPEWMGTIDYSGLKLKIIGSIVAISSIQLLKYFIEFKIEDWKKVGWMIGLHMTFVISGLLFALMERISHGPKPSPAKEAAPKH